MVEIKNVEVLGLERAMTASGNPMTIGEIDTLKKLDTNSLLSRATRCKKLGSVKAGSGHDNFLKGVIVQFDIKYPQYFTPELQRYNWIDIVSSQSKMHRLTMAGSKEDFHSMFNKYTDPIVIKIAKEYIDSYNRLELGWNKYVFDTEQEWKDVKYDMFMRALSSLPMGYEMWMTISTNFLQLKTIFNQRKDHKLKEDWSVFCTMIKELPMFIELTGVK